MAIFDPDGWDIVPIERKPAPGGFLQLLEVPDKTPVEVVFVSHGLKGFHAHWIPRQTHACVAGKRPCPWCLKQYPRKEYWFAQVIEVETKLPALLQLTADGAFKVQKWQDEHGSLEWRRALCRRRNNHKKSTILCTVLDKSDRGKWQAQERDITACLRRMWKFPTEVDGEAVSP